MADVLHKVTKQFLLSVNTPDFMDGNWLINPDMSVVIGLPLKYWVIEGDTLRSATTAERTDIDLLEEFQGMGIEEVKARINAKINVFRDTYINAGVIFMGHLFDSDERARENILGMCSAVGLGLEFPENFTWRSRANQDIYMGKENLTQFGLSVLTFVSTCFAVSWHHKDTVSAMISENIMDYIEYDFHVGWPNNSLDGTTL